MAQLLTLILQALSKLGVVLETLNQIRDLFSNSVLEHSDYYIEGVVTNTQLAVANPTYGLSAIHADLADVHTHVDAIDTNVQTLIASLNLLSTQVGSPFQADDWVPPPEAGPDADTIAYAVWRWSSAIYYNGNSSYNLNMQQVAQVAAGLALQHVSFQGEPLPANPFCAECLGQWDQYGPSGWSWAGVSTFGQPAVPDFSLWQADDTVLSFMQRTQAAFGWQQTGPGGISTPHIAWKPIGSGPSYAAWYRTTFYEPEAAAISTYTILNNPAGVPADVDAPPVWTGLAGVTLGDEVALVDQLVLDGPMDGVLVNVTTPPTRTGQYVIGGETYDYKAGEIAFATDRGDVEPWQYLGFRQAIFTPRTMTSADSALFRVLYGAAGTVRTFTRV